MKLEALRKEIDLVDGEIQKLLEKRFLLVASLKPLKSQIHDPFREEQILSKISSRWIREVYVALLNISKSFLKTD